MAKNWFYDVEKWKWNWTEFCGYSRGIKPLNPETHDLDICFQQLCLQIPVLVLIAVISAYHCGKRHTAIARQQHVYHAINIRILITICLAILPIIRAYIILTNTTIPLVHNEVQDYSTLAPQRLDISFPKSIHSTLDEINISRIRDELSHSAKLTESLFSTESSAKDIAATTGALYISDYESFSKIDDKFTSAKPVDYFVAGTEGLAWVVHLCFILNLKRGRRGPNPRGPILIRALIFLLIVISVLLLRSHVNNKPKDDVLPNLSLGFSISVVTLLILYTITLIPGPSRLEQTRASSRNTAVSFLLTAIARLPSLSVFSTIILIIRQIFQL